MDCLREIQEASILQNQPFLHQPNCIPIEFPLFCQKMMSLNQNLKQKHDLKLNPLLIHHILPVVKIR